MDDVVIMIPCLNPDDKFITHLNNLKNAGYSRIVVIDDGSAEAYRHYFDTAVNEYGCDLVRHNINLGQGRAYKSGFNFYMGKYSRDTLGVIQCDCDGQHDIEDINKCAELLRQNPEKFILGERTFDDRSIPFRSRFGNICTSLVFKLVCGLDIGDTQTGLKGIPSWFIPVLMETPGERFEYASSCLLETRKEGVEILKFPIKTIYLNGNETSHFNPLRDSIRIYSLIFKYLMSSLSAFIIDIAAFSIFLTIFGSLIPERSIIWATYAAKVISCTYTYFVNKNLVFSNQQGALLTTSVKFVILCVIQSTCSGYLTEAFVNASGWNPVLCKIIVDTLLFFVSFQIQNRWVFKNRRKQS